MPHVVFFLTMCHAHYVVFLVLCALSNCEFGLCSQHTMAVVGNSKNKEAKVCVCLCVCVCV